MYDLQDELTAKERYQLNPDGVPHSRYKGVIDYTITAECKLATRHNNTASSLTVCLHVNGHPIRTSRSSIILNESRGMTNRGRDITKVCIINHWNKITGINILECGGGILEVLLQTCRKTWIKIVPISEGRSIVVVIV